MRKFASALLILLSTSSVFAGWSEAIRISPAGYFYNPQILISGDTLNVTAIQLHGPMKVVYSKSVDAGMTWSSVQYLSSDGNMASIPKIVANNAGMMILWKNHISSGGPHPDNIAYCKSSDKGQTWSTQEYYPYPPFSDNYDFSVSAGPDSEVNIVAKTIIVPTDTTAVYSINSTDFGNSWARPSFIFGTASTGMFDQISDGNAIHLVWYGFFSWMGPGAVYYMRSTNGGLSWSENVNVSSLDNHYRGSSSICMNANHRLQVSWFDCIYSPNEQTGDILTCQSTDSGLTWGAERQASFDHFAAGSNDVASNGDTINIIWEDIRQGLSQRNIKYTRSTDDGLTWGNEFYLDSLPYESKDPVIAYSNDKIYAIWCDLKPNPDTNSVGGLFLRRWEPDPMSVDGNDSSIPEKVTLSAYPNPFNSSTTITLASDYMSDIEIFDISGRHITTIKTLGRQATWNAVSYTSGLYFARVYGNHSSSIKLILIK